MSILTQPLSPSFLHARQKLCIQQNTAKLPRSKDALHSRAAREIGRTFFRGVANNTHTTDAAHFPGCHQKVRLVPFLRS